MEQWAMPRVMPQVWACRHEARHLGRLIVLEAAAQCLQACRSNVGWGVACEQSLVPLIMWVLQEQLFPTDPACLQLA